SMHSLTVLLASLGVFAAAQQGGFGGRGQGGGFPMGGGMGGQGGFGGGFPGGPGGPGGRGGHGGHGGHPFGPPPPPFLANVTQEGRVAFFQLFQDQNQTKAQIKTAIDAWATTYGVSAEVTEFDTEMKAEQAERRAKVSTAVGQLADAISKLNSIEDAQDLSIAETREQIREAIDAMTPELRDLVLAAAPRPPRGGKGPHEGMGGGPGGFGGMGGQGGFGGMGGGQGGFGFGGQGGQFGGFGGQQGGQFGGNQGRGGRFQGRF
ncbi:hypothetical protein PENTCL1PPCAC_13808, partial [Pristionchus entomophagus]